ncbi:MAG: alpha/beta hydrolase-fold protein [Candidatus Brocadiia bacterium]
MNEEHRTLNAGGITSAQTQPEPTVHPDGRVTFRLEAPEAASVQVVPRGDDNGLGAGPYDMEKGDEGVWTVTIGPVRPGFHYYEYCVDGARCLHPHAEVYWGWGQVVNGADVPDPELDFYDPKDVPHGELRLHRYHSRITDTLRRVIVYTPPGYDDGDADYPVLHLQHGAGESERCWSWQGKANYIMDNLLADDFAVPMLVVMANGYAARAGSDNPGRPSREDNAFEQVVVEELVPRIDERYRTMADRRSRAIAGLSMGAGQALRIGLGHLDVFGSVGAFSGGGRNFDPATSYGGALSDPEEATERLDLLWVGSGRQDSRFEGAQQMHQRLEETGIEHVWFECDGAHEWQVWRKCLRDFAPRLFR